VHILEQDKHFCKFPGIGVQYPELSRDKIRGPIKGCRSGTNGTALSSKEHDKGKADKARTGTLNFEGNEKGGDQQGILFSLEDYLQLVDYTGRIISSDKRGAISITLPPILQRINIDLSTWLKNSTQFETVYHEKFNKQKVRRQLARAG